MSFTLQAQTADRTFGEDVDFLKKQGLNVIVLGEAGGPRVAIVPEYQGRIMTSTATGDGGFSCGWINYELIESKKIQPHINVFGGEDRFWMGPEGGQFSIFFKKGDKFDLEHWQTPACIDTEPFEVVGSTPNEAVFRRRCRLTNMSGTEFELEVKREVRLLSVASVAKELGIEPGAGVKVVGFQSVNSIVNVGKTAWTKETGLLSVWILGMFKPSPATTVVIPFIDGPESELGPIVNDAYFGKVPPDRMKVDKGVVYFKGDGQMRSKIGVGPKRAKPVLGSYDAERKVLTIVSYSKPRKGAEYVNSMWELQKEPFAGDVVNSYNDGPPAPGKKPLGPFYELETSSPAMALAPGGTELHGHGTYHFEGTPAELDAIALKVLGVTTRQISEALK